MVDSFVDESPEVVFSYSGLKLKLDPATFLYIGWVDRKDLALFRINNHDLQSRDLACHIVLKYKLL